MQLKCKKKLKYLCGYLVFPVPFVKATVLHPLNSPGIHVQNQLTIDVVFYFCTLNSIPLAYMFILKTVPRSFDYVALVSFEMRKCENFKFFLPQDCLGSSGL